MYHNCEDSCDSAMKSALNGAITNKCGVKLWSWTNLKTRCANCIIDLGVPALRKVP